MSDAFTPGPWRVATSPLAELIVRDIGGLICTCRVPTFFTERADRYDRERRQAEANARLIAAAPEMYEALAAMIEIGGDDDGGCVIAKASAALAKARGET